MTKIVSYNVNGIRAALNKGLAEWLKDESVDVFCIQESKAQPNQMDKALFEHLGYVSYIHSAEKKGYSGVATFSKKEADFTNVGMGMAKYDSEGRVLRTDYGDLTIVNVYIPSGTTGDVRQQYKMEFLHDFMAYIKKLRETRKNVIVSGDYNICHKPIDINHPERHKKSSGFLPEERTWLDDFVENGMVDSFRMFNSQGEQYTWWSYRANARVKNLGWRIDYHMVSKEMTNKVIESVILKDIYHSDHCPILLKIA